MLQQFLASCFFTSGPIKKKFVPEPLLKLATFIDGIIKFQNIFFLFSEHEPIYFTENKEKTLRVSYDRDTHTIEYMN